MPHATGSLVYYRNEKPARPASFVCHIISKLAQGYNPALTHHRFRTGSALVSAPAGCDISGTSRTLIDARTTPPAPQAILELQCVQMERSLYGHCGLAYKRRGSLMPVLYSFWHIAPFLHRIPINFQIIIMLKKVRLKPVWYVIATLKAVCYVLNNTLRDNQTWQSVCR